MPSPFVNLDVRLVAADFVQRVFDTIRTRWPDWEPADANLETWLIEGLSQIAEELADLITQVGAEVFRKFGQEVVNIPPIAAASATVTSTWTLNDLLGHTIEAGTQVALTMPDGSLAAFTVTDDVVVPPGSGATGAGAVLLESVETGEAYNDLAGPAELIDALSFVDPGGVAIVGNTGNGADAEDPVTYLARLAERLQLMSETLILPRDFEIATRDHAGVARAVAIDGYDPVGETFDNERMIAIYAHDVDGDPLSAPLKAEIDADLQERRETTFIVTVNDPDYTDVDVTATIVLYPEFDLTEGETSAEGYLESYLSPATWGASPTGDTTLWLNEDTVYRRELESVLDRVPGVRRVQDLDFGLDGGAQDDTDKLLTGPAPLTRPGVIAITATYG